MIIVASIAHDIWLASTLALASIVGMLTLLILIARQLREARYEG